MKKSNIHPVTEFCMPNPDSNIKLKIIVVGLGHQSLDDHIPAISECECFELVGVVDIDEAKASEVGAAQAVPFASDTNALLDKLDLKPDAALVAVPHNGYLPIIKLLAEHKIHIIKEKPFAVSVEDALQIKDLIEINDITLQVTLQRRFNPIFYSFQQLIKRIGKLHSIEARYTLNIARLDEGWRASRLYSGGGALVDLGYHYID